MTKKIFRSMITVALTVVLVKLFCNTLFDK